MQSNETAGTTNLTTIALLGSLRMIAAISTTTVPPASVHGNRGRSCHHSTTDTSLLEKGDSEQLSTPA
jgi:hypothetical protein